MQHPLVYRLSVVRARLAGGLRYRGRQLLRAILYLLTVTAATPAATAEPAQVLVLLSDSGGVYAELITALRDRVDTLAPGQLELHLQLVPESRDARAALFAAAPALIVSIGIRASALALEADGEIPVLSLLVPYDSYNGLPHAADAPHSAIYLDQPLARQLDLLQLLLPEARRVATLLGPRSAGRLPELQRESAGRGLRLISETVRSGANPVPAVSRLMDHAEVLLAVPDPAVFNRDNLQAILLTTYRSGVPVLGFSQAYVRSGALAAVHSTATQIGMQAGEWIARSANSGDWRLGARRHPAYYSVAVNAQVAQTLGIKVADEEVLLAQLRAREQRRNEPQDERRP